MKTSIIFLLLILTPCYSAYFADLMNDLLTNDSNGILAWEKFNNAVSNDNEKQFSSFEKKYIKTCSVEISFDSVVNLSTELIVTGDNEHISSIQFKWNNKTFVSSIRELLIDEYEGLINTQIYKCDKMNNGEGAYTGWLLEVKIVGKKIFWLEVISDNYSQGFDYFGTIIFDKSYLKKLDSFELCENESALIPPHYFEENRKRITDTLYEIILTEFKQKEDAEKVISKIKKMGLIEFGKKYPMIKNDNNYFKISVGLCNEEKNASKIDKLFKKLNYESTIMPVYLNCDDENFYQCPYIPMK